MSSNIPDGYYFDMNTGIETAYLLGVQDGKFEPDDFSVTYTLRHTHGTYCYPTAEPVYLTSKSSTSRETDNGGSSYYTQYTYSATYKCSACDYKASASKSTNQEWNFDDSLKSSTKTAAFNKVRDKHLINGTYCPNSGYQCGKIEDLQTVDNVNMIGEGDEIVSATINF